MKNTPNEGFKITLGWRFLLIFAKMPALSKRFTYKHCYNSRNICKRTKVAPDETKPIVFQLQNGMTLCDVAFATV